MLDVSGTQIVKKAPQNTTSGNNKKPRAEQNRAEPSRTEQNRAEPSRTKTRAEQNRAEPSRTEQNRAEPSRTEQEPSRTEQNRAEPSRTEQNRAAVQFQARTQSDFLGANLPKRDQTDPKRNKIPSTWTEITWIHNQCRNLIQRNLKPNKPTLT